MCYAYRQAFGKGKWPLFVQVHRSHVLASIHKLYTCRIHQLWECHLCVRVVQYAAKPGRNGNLYLIARIRRYLTYDRNTERQHRQFLRFVFLHRYFCGPVQRSRFSSVGITQSVQRSRYSDSLEVGRSRDPIPVGARFSTPVQTGPGAHPASYTMGTGSLLGVKRPGRDVDHPLHLVPWLKKEQSYTSTPPLGFRGLFQGELYTPMFILSAYYVSTIALSFNFDSLFSVEPRLLSRYGNQTRFRTVRGSSFPFFRRSTPVLGHTQPRFHCVQQPFSQGVKRPGRKADHPAQSSLIMIITITLFPHYSLRCGWGKNIFFTLISLVFFPHKLSVPHTSQRWKVGSLVVNDLKMIQKESVWFNLK